MFTQAPARAAYDPFASLYDRHMGADFARRAYPAMERLLRARLSPGARVLDLCCGSGRVTALLSERGYRVTGVDSSEPMLRLAKVNAPRAHLLLADARRLCLPPVFAAAVSTFNSLAHLYCFHDLALACLNVRAALAPGGAWLFDLTTEQGYLARWSGSYALVEAQECCIVRPSYDPQARLAANRITVFHGAQPEPGSCSDFTIFQKCHSDPELRAALAGAGFHRIQSYDAECDLGLAGESGHTFFLAS